MIPQALGFLVEEDERVLVEDANRCKSQDFSVDLTAVHGSPVGPRSVRDGDVVVTEMSVGHLDAGQRIE